MRRLWMEHLELLEWPLVPLLGLQVHKRKTNLVGRRTQGPHAELYPAETPLPRSSSA